MLITGILQLLAIGVDATEDDNQKFDWYHGISYVRNNISTNYFYKIIEGINDLEKDVSEYITKEFKPAFNHCGNNIESISIKPEFKSIENLFSKFTVDKFKELAKKIPEKDRVENHNWLWYTIKKSILFHEILKVLLDKKALPSIKIDDNTTGISFNAMINWLLYSVKILIGEEEFEKSEEVVKLKGIIFTIRKKLNTLLKEHENGGPVNEKKVTGIKRQINNLFDLSESEIYDIKIKYENIETQKKRYHNLVLISMEILQHMANCIADFACMPADPKDWQISVGLSNLLSNYTHVVFELFTFSISMDKLKEMSDNIKKLDKNKIFSLTELGSFNIFELYGLNKKDYQEVSPTLDTNEILYDPETTITPGATEILDPITPSANNTTTPKGNATPPITPGTTTPKTDDGWSIGTIILIGVIVVLVLGGGVVGIYYLTRKGKPVPEV